VILKIYLAPMIETDSTIRIWMKLKNHGFEDNGRLGAHVHAGMKLEHISMKLSGFWNFYYMNIESLRIARNSVDSIQVSLIEVISLRLIFRKGSPLLQRYHSLQQYKPDISVA
jgi:hypothetical protein